MSLYSFGDQIQGDVLGNVEDVRTWESYTLRAIFLVVMATHTPFVLFIGKESVLAIVALLYIRGKREEDLRKSTIISHSPSRKSAAASSESQNLLSGDHVITKRSRTSLHQDEDHEDAVDKAVMCSDNNMMNYR